ncbi:MAG: hypothetical protein HeimC3_02270 [Candidatus Heimdallarchaeota archaeon LC_3]|nr:MAG: hypothetical protein HeimC3_02270 [Candidatus Heimdallarchaeota archaeon LC_3]
MSKLLRINEYFTKTILELIYQTSQSPSLDHPEHNYVIINDLNYKKLLLIILFAKKLFVVLQ